MGIESEIKNQEEDFHHCFLSVEVLSHLQKTWLNKMTIFTQPSSLLSSISEPDTWSFVMYNTTSSSIPL